MSKAKQQRKQGRVTPQPDQSRRKLVTIGLGGLGVLAVGGIAGYKSGWFGSSDTGGAATGTSTTSAPAQIKALPPETLSADAANALRASDDMLRYYARELNNPSALIHAVRGQGKNFTLNDGSKAVDYLCSHYAADKEVNGKRYVFFPREHEVHDNSFLKTLLEAGVSADQTITVGSNKYTLRDLGDSAVISGRITQVLWTVAIIGVFISVASGLIASWLASRRVEALAHTARDVMAGDLKRRAPVRGEADEFDELAEAMNAMLDRLERLMQVSRTAGDAIAHDLRSPLTRFRQKLEAALDRPPDSNADRDALQRALEEADSLLDMFAAVLKLARVESNPNWRLERVDATEAIRELIEFYEPAAEDVGRTLRGEVAEGLLAQQGLEVLVGHDQQGGVGFGDAAGVVRRLAKQAGRGNDAGFSWRDAVKRQFPPVWGRLDHPDAARNHEGKASACLAFVEDRGARRQLEKLGAGLQALARAGGQGGKDGVEGDQGVAGRGCVHRSSTTTGVWSEGRSSLRGSLSV